MWGDTTHYVRPSKIVGGHVPCVPHQIAPMLEHRYAQVGIISASPELCYRKKEIVFIIAGQFSCGKEIREQEFYYETIALLILVCRRLGQSPSRKYRSSTKCEALFGFD